MQTPKCPKCGCDDRIAEVDVVRAYAIVQCIGDSGSVCWDGSTEVDWNTQRPRDNPAEFICLCCSEVGPLGSFLPAQEPDEPTESIAEEQKENNDFAHDDDPYYDNPTED